jgi:hypothetical protein
MGAARHQGAVPQQDVSLVPVGGRLGVSFRRQAPLVADSPLTCTPPKCGSLSRSTEGTTPKPRARSAARGERALEKAGYHVLRIDNEAVARDPPASSRTCATRSRGCAQSNRAAGAIPVDLRTAGVGNRVLVVELGPRRRTAGVKGGAVSDGGTDALECSEGPHNQQS